MDKFLVRRSSIPCPACGQEVGEKNLNSHLDRDCTSSSKRKAIQSSIETASTRLIRIKRTRKRKVLFTCIPRACAILVHMIVCRFKTSSHRALQPKKTPPRLRPNPLLKGPELRLRWSAYGRCLESNAGNEWPLGAPTGTICEVCLSSIYSGLHFGQ